MSRVYVRYAYWLDPIEWHRFEGKLAEQLDARAAKEYICEALRPSVKLGYVLPNVWSRACNRQGSWYRASSKAGKTLVVSSTELDFPGTCPETVIQTSNFVAPSRPGAEEQHDLVRSARYLAAKPFEWDLISSKEKDRITRHARLMGVRDSIEDILLSRSANHANFLEPCHYVMEDSETIPYSIGKSGKVCSSCLEFFNIIGSEFPTKLVVPCAGMVLYGGMRANRYYRVKSPAAWAQATGS